MTPRLIGLCFEGTATRLEREHNDRAWLAFVTANLVKTSKPVRLQDLQIKPKVGRRQVGQSPAAMKSVLKMITVANGGRVLTRG